MPRHFELGFAQIGLGAVALRVRFCRSDLLGVSATFCGRDCRWRGLGGIMSSVLPKSGLVRRPFDFGFAEARIDAAAF